MKYFVTISFLFWVVYSFAQHDFGINFNACYSGRTLGISKQIGLKNESLLDVGLTCNVNCIGHPDDLEKYHYKRLHASHWYEFLGIQLTYYKPIKTSLKPKFYWLTDVQVKYSQTRNDEFIPKFYDTITNTQYYLNKVSHYGPFLWVQNTYGIAIDVAFSNKLTLHQKIGVGVVLVSGKDTRYNPTENNTWFYPTFMYNIGCYFKL